MDNQIPEKTKKRAFPVPELKKLLIFEENWWTRIQIDNSVNVKREV